MRRFLRVVCWTSTIVGLWGAPALAEPLAEDDVPSPLSAWVDWALRDHEAERCPLLSSPTTTRTCAWPTRLSLTLGERGGSFEQRWRVERRLVVPLPGDERHWPQDVLVDGRAAAIGAIDGRPGVGLDAGQHIVRGRFQWDALPDLLQVPPQTALLALSLETSTGLQRVASPKRDQQGRLWLRQRGPADDGRESRLKILVYRRIVDDVPMHLETRIDLEVSGRSRELALGRALPQGFVPMSLSSPLPARIDADGRLRVQLRPGRFAIQLEARRDQHVPTIASTLPGGPWASSEVWVFEARPDLRLVTLKGATPIDPRQTTLPSEWKSLPAYLLKPGDSLELEEKRRGDADPAADLLALSRSWWLDFDGRGYTIQDRIEGEIRRSSRLDMATTTALGRVELNGRDQFITVRPDPEPGDDGFVGVEVPRGAVKVTAESRIDDAGSRVPAVGWDQDFHSLQGRLHLPPGWRLVHASGVDRAQSTWVNRWNLLDVFTALIIVLAFGRLWGIGWGAVAAAGMVLSYTESGAPQWAWLAVLIGEALARSLPEGRLAGWISVLRGIALATLLLIGVPFAVQQARIGLHPSLEDLGGTIATTPFQAFRQQDEVEALDEQVPKKSMAPVLRSEALPRRRGSLRGLSYMYDYEPDPGAHITTGPGLPGWAWREVGLSWNGPVTRSQQLGLILTPPWLTGLLSFVRIALVAALAACVVLLGASGAGWIPQSMRLSRAAIAGVWLSLLAGLVLPAAPARAEYPTAEILDELRTRLLAPPDCAPDCAAAPRLVLEADENRLKLVLEVDALAETGAPLPGGAGSWLPDRVRVDGAPASGLWAGADGVLWVHVGRGKHRIELSGSLPDLDSVELPLPLHPRRVEASLSGWVLHGLLEDGRAERTLQLTRVVSREAAEVPDRALEPRGLPPYVEIVRNIRMGLTWQVQTVVRRLTPIEPALRLDLPLLPGEAVTTAGIRTVDGRAKVALAPGISEVHWQSTLATQTQLALEAEDTGMFREVWSLDASPIWHVEAEGIPVVHQPSATAARARRWRPWPGERVTLAITRPKGVAGRTATIDATTLSVTPGLRVTDSTLALSLRSSRGGEHTIRLPASATLQSVTIGGVAQPIRQEGEAVVLPIVPGSQEISVAWQEPGGVGLTTQTPAVDLGMESVNASIVVDIPPSRWILAVRGPQLGPAVLFWSYAVVLAAMAFALGRVQLTPLRFHHWLLLGLGLSQAPIAAAAMVVVWLLALGARRSRGIRIPGRWFDLAQLALVGLTAIALVSLLISIQTGLLGLPEMQIEGNDSSSHHLRWYQDRAQASLPNAWILSLPLVWYRIAMLAWALWLAQALLRWLRWGWECFSHGELWRPLRSQKPDRAEEPASG